MLACRSTKKLILKIRSSITLSTGDLTCLHHAIFRPNSSKNCMDCLNWPWTVITLGAIVPTKFGMNWIATYTNKPVIPGWYYRRLPVPALKCWQTMKYFAANYRAFSRSSGKHLWKNVGSKQSSSKPRKCGKLPISAWSSASVKPCLYLFRRAGFAGRRPPKSIERPWAALGGRWPALPKRLFPTSLRS
jgi:hypothetical protein